MAAVTAFVVVAMVIVPTSRPVSGTLSVVSRVLPMAISSDVSALVAQDPISSSVVAMPDPIPRAVEFMGQSVFAAHRGHEGQEVERVVDDSATTVQPPVGAAGIAKVGVVSGPN